MLNKTALRAAIAARALEDEEFRRSLLDDPRGAVVREFGIALPETLQVEVHEESETFFHLVLPEPIAGDVQENDMLVFWERILRP